MIYLSAQPDEFYFTWQIDLLVYNFHSLGIKAEDIHILIGFDPQIGVQPHFKELIERNAGKASFYTYPDKRKRKNYIPSIRPHIIAQHFLKFPSLEKQSVFYHDSDIIFTALPDFPLLEKSETWYVSDTRSYLNSAYIKDVASEALFRSMCDVIGISTQLVEDNDDNCGGAQYLLKNTDFQFWDKIERDTEDLYIVMKQYNENLYTEEYEKSPLKKSQFRRGIQSWCSDMWVIFWNALLLNKKVEIHKELDFLVAKSPGSELPEKKILHYSGDAIDAPGPIFRKGKYTLFTPFFDKELSTISDKTVSWYFVNYVKKFLADTDSRLNLMDVSFIIPVMIDSESRLENLYAVCGYLNKFFKTNILIGEVDSEQKINVDLLPECCTHYFFKQDSEVMHRTALNNVLIQKSATKIIAIYDTDVVFPIRQIIKSVDCIREGSAAIVSPYNGEFKCVTNIFKPIFLQILDPELLSYNSDVFPAASERSFGGAIFINKEIYTEAGMDNETFTSWGPEDIERVKRMRILGYRTTRIEGNLYHLPHDRKINSGYQNEDTYRLFIRAYLNICQMNRDELLMHIKTWKSITQQTQNT